MTQDERRGIAWTLLVVYASQIISLPSCDADTRCLRSVDQCMAYILARWPLRTLRDFMPIRGRASVWLWATPRTGETLVSWKFMICRFFAANSRFIEWIPGHLQDVSASSSFLRLILSFRPSASRRAAAILACICSPDISDVIVGCKSSGREMGPQIEMAMLEIRLSWMRSQVLEQATVKRRWRRTERGEAG